MESSDLERDFAEREPLIQGLEPTGRRQSLSLVLVLVLVLVIVLVAGTGCTWTACGVLMESIRARCGVLHCSASVPSIFGAPHLCRTLTALDHVLTQQPPVV